MKSLTVRFFVWLLVAVALLYWFAHQLQWEVVKGAFGRMNVGLVVLSMMPVIVTYWVRSLRWRAFLAPIGSASLRNLFSATVTGYASIFIFGRVGEIGRPIMLSLRQGLRPSATIATIMIERIYDMVSVGVLFAIDLLFMNELKGGSPSGRELSALKETGAILLLVSALSIIGLSVFRLRAEGALDYLDRKLRWLPRKFQTVILNLLRHLADGLYVLHDWRGLGVTIGYTLLTWGLVVVSFCLIGLAFGLQLPVTSVIFVIGFAMVGSLVPTPGGSAGAFHTATMIGLMLLGIEKNTAASVAVVMHFVAFGTALLFGPYFLVRGGISFKELRRMAEAELSSHAQIRERQYEETASKRQEAGGKKEESRSQEVKPRMKSSRFRLLAPGFWLLASGFWYGVNL